jgi:outer membrane beta-barrel protein
MQALLMIILSLLAMPALAEPPAPAGDEEQAIVPVLDRREIVIPRIDTEDFELSAFAGLLSIDDFGNSPVYGARAAYHVSEDFFVEASYGHSRIEDSAFRRFGLPLFEDERESLQYYHLSVGYNALPAEFFAGSSRAFSGGLYLAGGVGSTRITGEDHFTYNLGGGLRLLPTDWLVLRTDVRAYAFESDLLGEEDMTYHLEVTANIGVFF